jgi:DNA-binding GntR family transcriptional regulator
MGVSVDTIRAAMKVLREEGLIESATGIGHFVAVNDEGPPRAG